MISTEVQEAIIQNIKEFDERERQQFKMRLVEEAYNDQDLIDMINVKETEDYWDLDTAVRDNYMDAFLKMHINNM